jgi:esterase/lipase
MIYYPNNQNFENCDGFKDYEKINYNGTRFYYKEQSKNVIVYYHGNAGSACDRSSVKSVFEQSNESLIFVEYTGYSDDKKEPDKNLILQDVQNIHNFIEENSFNKITIYGESIGSGAASYHAYLGNVNSLILVAPFSRLEDVAQSKYIIYPASILVREKYDNIKWLQNFKEDIIILHGDSDTVIPNRFSQKLFNEIPTDKKEYVLIEGKGHNDIWTSAVFTDNLIEFINRTNN